MKILLSLFALMLTVAACVPGGGGSSLSPDPEIIDADLREDRTLVDRVADPNAPDYLVTVRVGIAANVIVEPGVRIEFERDTGLWVGSATGEGSLHAVGTSEQPIVFASAEPDDAPTWTGIGFGSPSELNRLEFVTVSGAGSAPSNEMLSVTAGVTLWDGRLEIVDSKLVRNLEYGFAAVTSPGAAPELAEFRRNELSDNGAPALITSNLFGSLDAESTFTGNTADRVELRVVDFDPRIISPQTIVALDVPYRIEGPIQFVSDVVIEAGVQLLMAPDSTITAGGPTGDGSLTLAGTAESPIRIVGEVETAGSWTGIFIESGSPQNRFEHVDIGYGGGAPSQEGLPANIIVGAIGGESWLSLSDASIHDSAGYGVFVRTPASLDEARVTYDNNASGARGTDAL